jgi:hypothetical protein
MNVLRMRSRSGSLVMAALILALTCVPASVRAQGSDADQVRQGCDLYTQARFQEAITILEKVLLRGQLTDQERFDARLCLARAYTKEGDERGAMEVFKSILRIDPTWEPDPYEIPPDEIAVFEKARAEIQSEQPPVTPPPAEVTEPVTEQPTAPQPTVEKEKGGKPWWLWPAVGVAAVGGVIVALVAGGGDSGGGDGNVVQELPPFPDPPAKN